MPDSRSMTTMNLFLRIYLKLPPSTLPLTETPLLPRIAALVVLISGEHLAVEFFLTAELKTADVSSIPRMSILEFFLLFYPCDYIKLVLIPQTNKHIAHEDMDFSEFLIFFGSWLYMACFEGVADGRMR